MKILLTVHQFFPDFAAGTEVLTRSVALELMREVNFPASLSLYGLCGVLWLYRGSLRELWHDARALPARLRSGPR